MSFPMKLTEKQLAAAEAATVAREEARVGRHGEYTEQEIRLIEVRADFLEVFEETLSVKYSARAVNIAPATVSQWKSKYFDFAVRWDEIIDEAASRLFGSVMARAMGYVTEDKSDPTGLLRDPAGNIVYTGGNDKLAMAAMKAYFPDTFGDKKAITVDSKEPLVLNFAPPSNADS